MGRLSVDSPSGTSATGTLLSAYSTSDAPALGLYFPEAHGAVGDGTTDDTTAINAAITAANAAGGGTVMFRPVTYKTGTIPPKNGVRLVGAEPSLTQQVVISGTYLPDGEWNYSGGTVFKGDGTVPCIDTGQTDQGSLPANVGNTQLSGFGIENIGIDGYTYGIKAGAQYVMGLVWGKIRRVYIKNCSQWGVYLVNFQHMDISKVSTAICQNGQYYGAGGNPTAPGNSTLDELYNLVPRDGRDSRLCRGIVFEGKNGGSLNEISASRVQCNRFNTTLLSVTAGLTSASSTITVPDGTKFAVGMPVQFTTTGNGITSFTSQTRSNIYVVQSVSGNTITIGSSRTGTVFTASGTASMTLESYGHANVEITTADSSSHLTGGAFTRIDVEGNATVGVYLENCTGLDVSVDELPGTCLVHIVARNFGSRIHSNNAATTDLDGNSGSSIFTGSRSTIHGRTGPGSWFDQVIGTRILGLFAGGALFQDRTGSTAYPLNGVVGEHITTKDTGGSINQTQAGVFVFNGAAGQTITMQTIATDASSPQNSIVGTWWDFANVSANSLTVNTDGTQLFNAVAAKTSLTVPSQNGLKLVAAKTAGGTLFWKAHIYALA